MDYVDYKTYIRRYQRPYINVGDECIRLLLNACECFCDYGESYAQDQQEWIYIRHYGKFLYYFASIESLCIIDQSQSTAKNTGQMDYSMISSAIEIVKQYVLGELGYTHVVSKCLAWVRMYWPIVYQNRLYKHAIQDSVCWLKEKYGY